MRKKGEHASLYQPQNGFYFLEIRRISIVTNSTNDKQGFEYDIF